MKKTVLISFLFFLFTPGFSQHIPPVREEAVTDSSKTLDEITVKAFEQSHKAGSVTATVKVTEFNNADRYNKTSLVNGFNSVAGVRMEERSPGSYRINIRGSSLRSPFGVRNVKVYWNDIPVTDPGGNTYFNQFAWNNFSYIEIYKGPAGSLYGAGTGGLILLNSLDRWQPGVSLEYITGSYRLQNVFASAKFGTTDNRNQVTYAHNQSDGYRIQTKMRRDNLSWQSQVKISDKQQLTASLLFTDMYYQTPGALTLAEFTANPKNARPAAGSFPSAVNAKAAIYQKNLLAAFTNQYKINTVLNNSTTLYGAFAQVKNPAIRNYERRNEPGFGGRSVFTYAKKALRKNNGQEYNILQVMAGSELQQGYFNTQVSKNKNGNPDTLQTNDDINYTVYSFFLQGDLNLKNSWFITTGISINKTKVGFSRLSAYPVIKQSRSYRNELAPRIAIKKILTDHFFMKTTIARGFSPPTLAELLPSTGVISTDLEAEYGWNYEMTAHFDFFHRRLQVEATGIYFKLNNALVQRRDLSGADFFVNAGAVQQKSLEITADYFGSNRNSFLTDYRINAAYTYSHFRYGDFVKGNDDFSGKIIPSVPAHTFSVLADMNFKNGLYSNATYYAASDIFLNDANTASANAYHLLGWRFGWKKSLKKKNNPHNYRVNFYAGADNLLDETYSLGNDINAAANRFYNAAPRRNYYAGVSFQWIKLPGK
ncbi:MAG: TonB-dependent receptor plug domain-containing protein [Chitinophagaceae bacterium]|nr:TonB-dependent receptor plug domain-containing protein [Chitinophagaceae bacterium]